MLIFRIMLLCFVFASPVCTAQSRVEADEKLEQKCGVNCAYLALRAHGKEVRFKELAEAVSRVEGGLEHGSTLATLRDVIESYGLHARAVRTSLEQVHQLKTPAILYVTPSQTRSNLGHYYFVFTNDENVFAGADPPNPIAEVPAVANENHTLLILTKKPLRVFPSLGSCLVALSALVMGLVVGVLGYPLVRRPATTILICSTLMLPGCTDTVGGAGFRLESKARQRLEFHGKGAHELVWSFENSGAVPLAIESVSSSCSCLDLSTSGKSFEPGAEGKIRAKLKSLPPGERVVVAISVRTNDSTTPVHKLYAELSHVVELGVKPKQSNFELGEVRVGEPLTREIPFWIRGTSNIDAARIAVEPIDDERAEIRSVEFVEKRSRQIGPMYERACLAVVEFVPSAAGSYSSAYRLHASSESYAAECTVKFLATVTGRVQVVPKQQYVGRVRVGEVRTCVFKLRGDGEEIRVVDTEADGCTVQSVGPGASGGQKVVAQVSPSKPGAFTATIACRLSVGANSESVVLKLAGVATREAESD